MGRALLLSVAIFVLPACSVGTALSGEEQKDTSFLELGTPRVTVTARLGEPAATQKDEAGRYQDTYIIVKGNAPSAGRAVAHGVMDVLTLGVWEVVGTPLEAGAGHETETKLVILYDNDDRLKDLRYEGVEKEHSALPEESPTSPIAQLTHP